MSIDLDSLSIAELKQIEKDAAALAERKREQAIISAREQIKQIAASVDMSVEDLLGLTKAKGKSRAGKASKKTTGKRSGKPAPIKFRNPRNLEETWSGRGRKPVWLQTELEKGKKLESFAI